MNDAATMQARARIESFIKEFAPRTSKPVRVVWSLSDSLGCTLRFEFDGWSQAISCEYRQDDGLIFGWGSTERDLPNALAFLHNAQNVVTFGARLFTYIEEIRKEVARTKS